MKNRFGIPSEGFTEKCRLVGAEGMVLLRNVGEVLPLAKGEKVSVFGRCQIDFYRSGTGSGGSVNVEYSINLLEGLRNKSSIIVNEEVAKTYENWIKENPFDDGGGGWAAEPWYQKEMKLDDNFVKKASENSDKAIIVIGRTAGEDKDNSATEGSYYLTKTEKDMIKNVTKYFKKTILLLNVSNAIDMNFVDEDYKHPINSVMYVWQGGMEGGNSVADILVGDRTPSGKLTSTIAYSIEDYPSTKNYGNEIENYYEEDIYVGYRYFETFAKEKVQYPFGYGISYTTFNIQIINSSISNNRNLKINIKVTNTGNKYSGKEVVQLYYEAPQGLLKKPSKILANFTKTKLLSPNESQILTINFDLYNMASYDDENKTQNQGSYVLEKGFYEFYIGNSVRNIKSITIDNNEGYYIEDTIVVEKLQNVLAPVKSFKKITPGKLNQKGLYDITYQDTIVKDKNIVKDRYLNNIPKDIKQIENQGYTLVDVSEGKIDMDTFISQLTTAELVTIVRGEGMCSPLVTPGTASAFGGLSEALTKYKIPAICCADGPSGIRMDGGLRATQVPIGTLLASTWNTELIEELYDYEGKEMINNKIDTLLGPGVNIMRNPLNGRNFEYFSEDPLITGKFAAAISRGLRKNGVHPTIKHFACNNQEKDRSKVDAIVSERALREIYLKGFEIAVKESDAKSIMTSYNPINGHWCASNYDLNTTVLRNEWGFDGIVMTDWWAKMNDVTEGGDENAKYLDFMVASQNDLYMVVPNEHAKDNDDNLLESLENNTLTIGQLQRSAKNICNFIMTTLAFRRKDEYEYEVFDVKLESEFDNTLSYETIYNSKNIELNSKENTFIKIDNPGVYDLSINLACNDHKLAQVNFNLFFNNQMVTTIQTNGTDNKFVDKTIKKVHLEKGIYEIKLEGVKDSITINYLTLKEVLTNSDYLISDLDLQN